LATASGVRWLGWLGPQGGLLIEGPATPLPRVQVQDDRQFGMAAYEFQLYAPVGARLEPGQPVELAFRLAPASSASLAAAEQRLRQLSGPLAMNQPLVIRAVSLDKATVPRYGRLELSIDLQATYDNPFDPEQIDVTAAFLAPSGRELTVPGFLYRPYARSRAGNSERLVPSGPPSWRVRFAPTEVGEYRFQVTARDRSGHRSSVPATFQVTAGNAPGYVRVSPDDPMYFAHDDGSPYFALGANVCWPGSAGTYDYDEWFPRYAAAGGNYARLWLGPFDVFTLERQAAASRDDTGLGRYDLANAWRLDYVLELAERQGLKLMYCLESFNALRSRPQYNYWHLNPYNAANGGPLATPEAFFTDEQARRVFKQRLRYLVARWGYSPNLLAWEFWNEVDIIDKYVSSEVVRWHEEMSRYLREIDPWKHLQTTSYAGSAGDPAVDRLPEMDYSQTHRYGPRDMGADLPGWSARKRAYGKPHYVGEFGLDAGGSGSERDPDGLSWHNGLWASVMAGDAGAGMLWWWDSYIHPRNLYYHLAALAAFTQGIDWPRQGFAPAAARVEFVTRPTQPIYEDLVLTPSAASWSPSPANQPVSFSLPRSGPLPDLTNLSGLLHGLKNHRDKHNPATFALDVARPSTFQVSVNGVSGHGGAALLIRLDGQEVLTREFADPDGLAKTDTLRQYDGKYSIDLPAGPHTVVVENTGADWFYVGYTVTGYREVWEPRLRATALAGKELVLAWVQHRDSTWSRRADGVEPGPIAGARLVLPALSGAWTAELWDTFTGQVINRLPIGAAEGASEVALPPIERDLAVKIRRR
ncbi:MAG: DUF5060 domain-containing protein, partial [Armatimonadetes bacterium]|nr:DUF5060 domain-containing protein [Armatimonadota bacterium]